MARIVLLSALAQALVVSPAMAIIISASQNTGSQGSGVTGPAVWDGVANIINRDVDGDGNLWEPIDDQWCTGTLINGPGGIAQHLVTAGHCLFSNTAQPGASVPIANFRVNFPEPNNGINGTLYSVTAANAHPSYNNATLLNDIAVMALSVDLAGVTTSYNINQPTLIADERANQGFGLIGNKVGFGLSGDGVNGATGNPANTPIAGDPDARQGTRRDGDNFIELFGPVTAANNVRDSFGNVLSANINTLIYDFDNHVAGGNGPLDAAVNASLGAALAGQFTGPSAGIFLQEVDTASGDSGGPMFQFHIPTTQWLVVGVTSFGTDGGPPGSRFGDISVDTRVQSYSAWIATQVPEPNSCLLAFCGLFALVGYGRRRRRTAC